jgi:hypothetical protein
MLKAPDKDTTWQFIHEKLNIDLTSIKNEVLNFKEEWSYDTSRQDRLATHKDTEMFQLRFISYDWQIGDGNNSHDVYSLKNKDSQDCLNKIYDVLENYYDGKVVRCEIIKMKGKSNIQPHIDSGEFLYSGRRIHVPLITNDKIIFSIFNNDMNLKVGNWYEINNSLPHSVNNPTDEERIHIIIDIMQNKYLEV